MKVLPGLILMAVVGAALAAPGDPTQPPDAYRPKADRLAGGGDDEALVLQSVLIGADRKLAVISGQAVPLGGKIGGAKLVALDEKSATLQDTSGRRVLRLVSTTKQMPSAAGANPGVAKRGGE